METVGIYGTNTLFQLCERPFPQCEPICSMFHLQKSLVDRIIVTNNRHRGVDTTVIKICMIMYVLETDGRSQIVCLRGALTAGWDLLKLI